METAEILQILQEGEFEVEGVLPWSSNYAFLVTMCLDGADVVAVYKPRRGERPLWDFTTGTLCQREQAAFLVSEGLGWQLIPPTVLRDGPHGIGSVQLFIQHNPENHYFTFEGSDIHRQQLQQMALLDVVINNADRKSGHVLLEEAEDETAIPTTMPVRIWGIDHGICFHSDYKLRSVIWEFAGWPIPDEMLEELTQLQQLLTQPDNPLLLNVLLSPDELTAMQRRLDKLLRQKIFPQPGPGRHYPWPPV
ncbi:MAG: SCO1664 family protein [Chloroflexota bacterium]